MNKGHELNKQFQELLDKLNDIEMNTNNESMRGFAKLMRKSVLIKINEEDKKSNGTIERFLISKQAPLTESALVEKCRSSLVKNSDDQILEQKKARLEQFFLEVNPKIRRIYLEIKAGFDAGYDIENQIRLTIEDYALESPDAYILIIYYFYLQRSIDDDCVIRLCLYLYYTSTNHYKSHVKGGASTELCQWLFSE